MPFFRISTIFIFSSLFTGAGAEIEEIFMNGLAYRISVAVLVWGCRLLGTNFVAVL